MNGESIHVQHDTDCVAKQNRPSCILPIVINSLAHKETQQGTLLLSSSNSAVWPTHTRKVHHQKVNFLPKPYI